MAIYSGSTPKFLVKIKDEAGIQLDPSNTDQVTEVKITLFNAITSTVFGRFYLNQSSAGYNIPMTVQDNGEGDLRVKFHLTAAQTEAAEGNSNRIQITITVPDPDIAGGRVIIKTGKFAEVVRSKS